MDFPREITFKTPAKVNFFLFIQRKLPNGYHELLMDMIPISLFDTISIAPPDKNDLEFSSNLPFDNIEANLVVKAVRLLEKTTQQKIRLRLHLTKQVPIGAGLGGGSANAAGTLVVVNRECQLGLTDTELRALALKLGADVPFFINPKPSLVQGIGEILKPLQSFETLQLLLIYPQLAISTAFAYGHCSISGRKKTIESYTPNYLQSFTSDTNDFWNYLAKEFPTLNDCRRQLNDQQAVYTTLSGSGSTVFGVFTDEKQRDHALNEIQMNPSWQCYPCHTLSAHNYTNIRNF